jgi:hypothetical protein
MSADHKAQAERESMEHWVSEFFYNCLQDCLLSVPVGLFRRNRRLASALGRRTTRTTLGSDSEAHRRPERPTTGEELRAEAGSGEFEFEFEFDSDGDGGYKATVSVRPFGRSER